MNRNCYRLIFNRSLAKWVPVAETARRHGRAASKPAVILAGLLLVHAAQAELPVPCAAGSCSAPTGAVIPGFVTAGEAAYQSNGINAVVNQVGDKAVLNWQSFNVSPGHSVQFQQVDNLATQNLVPGANFTSLNRIWDLNPSVIAGMLTQAAGQKANVILVNSNGIAFMGGSQVNLNSFTASTLNMQDSFLANFLPGTDAPQFENALGGGEAHGFIKVLEGAQISAGNFGRVMLIAPTVVNKGKVTAPDGQVIAAAGTRAYLRSASSSNDANVRGLLVEVDSPAGLADFDTANASVRDGVLDGQAVRLTDAVEDKLGHATNLGELATPRGNVTMVGLAVNQQGIARATTSVVSNGSVYLLAKDTKTGAIDNITTYGSARGGRVTMGAGSRTEIGFDLRTPVLDEGKISQAIAQNKLDDEKAKAFRDGLYADVNAVANGVLPPSRIDAYLKEGELKSEQIGTYLRGEKGPRDPVSAHDEKVRYLNYLDTTGTLDGTTGRGLAKVSQARVQGQDIRMAGAAAIVAPAGEVKFEALDNPSLLQGPNSPFDTPNAAASHTARIHIDGGARISVAGLEGVPVSAARNTVEVELRGDELKDSPANQQGALRGEKVYLDIQRALANANAGKSTLIAKDSLESYQAKIERTVAERSTAGGQVDLLSQGETILESGTVIDLSGGSLKYTPAQVKTTLLTSNGKLFDLAEADAGTRYDGIATRYVRDYGRWNVRETIDLGPSFRYDPGYADGKNAGAMGVIGMKGVVMQADVQGRTTVGELQRHAGQFPKGARLTFGSDAVTDSVRNDYKLNQRIEVSSTGATLPAGFKFGDALPQGLRETLVVNPALLGQDRIATLEIFGNQAAEVREALRAPQGGGVHITAKDVTVLADIDTGSGSIELAARNNLVGALTDPKLEVGDGVMLSARGAWANEFPGSGGAENLLPLVDGGEVSLTAEVSGVGGVYETRGTVALGPNTRIDVTGGGRVLSDGKLVAGKGGDVTLAAYALEGVGSNLAGYALGEGGSLALTGHRVQIGGNPDSATGTLNLDAGFFGRGGFADFAITALDRLKVNEGTVITPTVVSLDVKPEYLLNPSGSRVEGFSERVRRDDRLRQAANIQLAAKQSGVGTGEILIGAGARIQTDPKARIALEARNKIDIEGELVARGGTISATLDRSSGAVFDLPNRNPIWLGDKARLDVSGVPLTYVDNRGLVNGEVLPGGTVKLNAVTGYVVSESGSRIDMSGATPVRLDVPNESGSLGRMVGSDAGTLSVFAEEGMLLDGALAAQAGSASNRGGVFSATLSKNARLNENQTGFDAQSRVLSLAQTGVPQTAGLSPDDPIPNSSPVRAQLSTSRLEQAGFDRISLSSRDAIQLEDGLNVGAARIVPLREVKLDAARITTTGGDASIKADAVRMGNYDGYRLGGDAAYSSSGALKADARLLELAGNLRLRGMQRAELTGSEAVRLTGTFAATAPTRPGARIESAADLLIRSAVVAPSTYSRTSILAPGKTVSFTRPTDTPLQPFSAQGSLTVEARDILQDGNLWAPFGQIELKATNAVTFKEGSLTSVAAMPGSLVPFGKLQNGRQWVVDVAPNQIPAGQLKLDALAEKSVRIEASSVDMQSGAKVDLSGGGDLQGYEFTVGPGGSRDILAGANTYAILPGYTGGYAAADPQEGFDRASGEAVFLAGMPGLADGTYTLLPAHYALLPGAYAVRLDGGIKNVLPGHSYTRQDGVRIAAGYVTDTRAGAPRDANWQGVEVLTHDQVRARSEFTLTRAAEFFADSRNRPQDAGLLSVSVSGGGAGALKLDSNYRMGAGDAGRGGRVDISARKLAVTGGAPAAIDPAAVQLDAARLNALGADSLLLGATRSVNDDVTTLAVGADTLTVANDGANALKSPEILLAATDTLTLKSGSVIDAQGAPGDAGHYETSGNGAFVRAASTAATFARTGSPDRSQGTLRGAPDSVIRAANSVILDATKENAFDGIIDFSKDGAAVAGSLALGATRINFGAAPAGSEGLTYTQAELDALDLAGLALTSYSTFDLYGGVTVGALDGNGKPVLQNLTLQGAGLRGINNASQTAHINAKNLTFTNPGSAQTFTAGGTGNLAVTADTLTLGAGDKAVKGFGSVSVTANELIAAAGTGKLDVVSPVTINVARIGGERNSDQTLVSAGALAITQRASDRALAPVTALGAKWAMQGTSVDFGSLAELPSGGFKLTASSGDVTLGANAHADVAGREVQFFDVKKPSWGGTAEFVSETGNIEFKAGSKVNVSAAAGGDAGALIVRATNGAFTAAQGSIQGQVPEASGARGEGARAEIDVKTLAGFSALNTALNTGGFDGARALRVRNGDVTIAAGDTVKANAIRIVADAGKLDVAGKLDASGGDAGRIELHARDDVNIVSGARLDAVSTGVNEDGGDVEIGTREGRIDLASGSAIDVTGGSGGQGGTLLLRAPRNGADVNVNGINSAITGARSVAVEAVRIYDNVTSLVASGGSGSTLSLATLNTDNNNFAAGNAAIETRLGKTGDPLFHILSGVEIRSAGDLTLGADWNLSNSRAGGEPGVLTLRAAGNLKLNSNLSDGFSHATPVSSGTTPANLLSNDSWAYRLVGGADSGAADPLATRKDGGDVVLASGKLVRTGTGDIRIAAGRDIQLKDNKAVIYTAGRAAPALSGFTNPLTNAYAKFSEDGGDVVLAAQGNIDGAPSAQLFNNWLFRQGKLNADGSAYLVQPAWWVRFDQFQQGIGTLGGGDVSLTAGGTIKNMSVSAPTQARMASMTPNAAALKKTGGGSVRVEAGGDVLGGQYYADRGKMLLKTGGTVGSGQTVFSKPVYSILALGDAQAEVQAKGTVNIHTVLNPHWIVQSTGSAPALFNVSIPTTESRRTLFSTYAADSGVSLASLSDSVALHNGSVAAADLQTAYAALLNTSGGGQKEGESDLLSYSPPTLEATAFQGDIIAGGTLTLMPAARGNLSLLARDSVRLNRSLTMSDRDPALLPSAVKPASSNSQAKDVTTPPLHQLHAATPVHTGDRVPVRVYAVNGDITGISEALGGGAYTRLDVSKPIEARAGRDVRDFSVHAQHTDDQARSVIQAGRDLMFASGSIPTNADRIWIGGPGRLEVSAGRDIDLGTSAGIVSRGDLDNPNLPAGGADIHLAAGTGANGVDYQAAVDRLIAKLEAGSPDDAMLWHARWLTADDALDAGNALAAVRRIDAMADDAQREKVRDMLFTALRTTGRDSLKAGGAYAADYARGYAALELVFPGIGDRNSDGSFKHYQGGLNMFASRVKTERGGDIEFLLPGGGLIVGLSNTPANLVNVGNDVLGMVTVADGDIRGFARDDILVNQSRILTVGGGDVLLWSSDGDIDAGKGKKTATAVPPPVIKVDSQGNVTQELQGAASGSGIGALATGGGTAGDVDLIAPKGTVNAGDAGIRARNLNIAAQVVLGADNISVSGTSTGTPVADTSAVTATTSGATAAGDEVSKAASALAQGLSDAAREAEEIKKRLKPTFISAEVIGHGE